MPSQFRQSYPPPGPCPTTAFPTSIPGAIFPRSGGNGPAKNIPSKTIRGRWARSDSRRRRAARRCRRRRLLLPQAAVAFAGGPGTAAGSRPDRCRRRAADSEEAAGRVVGATERRPPPSTPVPGGGLPGLPPEPATSLAPATQTIADPTPSLAKPPSQPDLSPSLHRRALKTPSAPAPEGCKQTGCRSEILKNAPVEAGPAHLRHRTGTKPLVRRRLPRRFDWRGAARAVGRSG